MIFRGKSIALWSTVERGRGSERGDPKPSNLVIVMSVLPRAFIAGNRDTKNKSSIGASAAEKDGKALR